MKSNPARRVCIAITGLALGLALVGPVGGQVATEANKNYRTEEGRAALERGLGNPAREQTQKPAEVVAALGIRPGATVADVGTGVGFMLPYLSKAAGKYGVVLAEDIQNDFLAIARKKAADEKLGNVRAILGGETDPKLPSGAVDLELLLDVYHHFDYPEKMLAALRAALRDDGRMAIVEYYKQAQAPGHIRLDRDEVVREVESNGFRAASRNDHITDQQYLVIFVKK
jgi:ubiquinone/menaquinone biosynthesis C-methylase UbiE